MQPQGTQELPPLVPSSAHHTLPRTLLGGRDHAFLGNPVKTGKNWSDETGRDEGSTSDTPP